MEPKAVAEWLLENPQVWFQLAGLVAEKNWNYADQIGQAFEDMAERHQPDNI